MDRTRRLLASALPAALALSPALGRAQAWPTRPIRLIAVPATIPEYGSPCESEAFLAPLLAGGETTAKRASFEGTDYTELTYAGPKRSGLDDYHVTSFALDRVRPGDAAVNQALAAALPDGTAAHVAGQCVGWSMANASGAAGRGSGAGGSGARGTASRAMAAPTSKLSVRACSTSWFSAGLPNDCHQPVKWRGGASGVAACQRAGACTPCCGGVAGVAQALSSRQAPSRGKGLINVGVLIRW